MNNIIKITKYLVLIFIVIIGGSNQIYAHDTNSITYTNIEIVDKELRFINIAAVGSHLFYAGFEGKDRQKIIESIKVTNNNQTCPLTNFLTHTKEKYSSAPYYFIAKCGQEIKNLHIEDNFPLDQATFVYIVNYKEESLTLTGAPGLKFDLTISGDTMTSTTTNTTTSTTTDSETQSNNPTSSTSQNSEAQTGKTSQATGTYRLFATYVSLGLQHILSGLDHIFFILGFILLASSLGGLLKGVTGFTVSHSLTLSLAVLSIVRISPAIVEPIIALSIAIVGILATFQWVKNWLSRFSIIFLFGLFHGLGFAGSIQEVGFPRQGLVAALLGFNIGIEIGQLLFVFSVFPLLDMLRSKSLKLYSITTKILALGISLFGLLWTIQRVLTLYSL